MCIVLLTTAHPSYALIVIDNRDEFILRPTSRPHWWIASSASPQPGDDELEQQQVLSSRDLQRQERGTWLGVTRTGRLAVLTNYRESDDENVSVCGSRSRGVIVKAWLGAPASESIAEYVARTLRDGGVKGVGGFSLLCGTLRRQRRAGSDGGERRLEPLAIISNRNEDVAQVPWIANERGEFYGLSNTSYADPVIWPKIKSGKQMLRDVVAEAVEKGMDEDALVARLFGVLDKDTLSVNENMNFQEQAALLKTSVFIPPIGDEEHKNAMRTASQDGKAAGIDQATQHLRGEQRPDEQLTGFATGMFGTQRQTILLVDWDGNVTYIERALWDANGNSLERGKGDVAFRFKIEGWDDEEIQQS